MRHVYFLIQICEVMAASQGGHLGHVPTAVPAVRQEVGWCEHAGWGLAAAARAWGKNLNIGQVLGLLHLSMVSATPPPPALLRPPDYCDLTSTADI